MSVTSRSENIDLLLGHFPPPVRLFLSLLLNLFVMFPTHIIRCNASATSWHPPYPKPKIIQPILQPQPFLPPHSPSPDHLAPTSSHPILSPSPPPPPPRTHTCALIHSSIHHHIHHTPSTLTQTYLIMHYPQPHPTLTHIRRFQSPREMFRQFIPLYSAFMKWTQSIQIEIQL